MLLKLPAANSQKFSINLQKSRKIDIFKKNFNKIDFYTINPQRSERSRTNNQTLKNIVEN